MSCLESATKLPPDLVKILRAYSPLAIAFSGGLDSRFLSHAASLLSIPIHLLHIRGPHVPRRESEEALAWAKKRGLAATARFLNPLDVPEVRANGRERCYHCKRYLFAMPCDFAGSPDSGREWLFCDGSNASDQMSWRPGLRALSELGVHSPLAEAGLRKEDIRLLAAATGLDNPQQRARPCLLTRFAYGLALTPEALTALQAAEYSLEAVLSRAARNRLLPVVPDFRLRLVAGRKASGRLPYATQLHLGLAGRLLKNPAARDALWHDLTAAATSQGFLPPQIRCMDAVSGHYDKVPPPTP